MSTLAELRTRLERSMGLYGSVPTTDIQGHALDALNDALIGLARRRKWYWWLEEDTSTLASLAAATETSTMPSDLGRIECIIDPEGNPVRPKTPVRQRKYPVGIGEGSYQTYAMGGIDSSTHYKSILWSPALLVAGDYVLWYYRVPAKLSADSDEPDLPEEFHDYLYWRALSMLQHSVEERSHIMKWSRDEAATIFQEMEQQHARVIETLSRRIYATA